MTVAVRVLGLGRGGIQGTFDGSQFPQRLLFL